MKPKLNIKLAWFIYLLILIVIILFLTLRQPQEKQAEYLIQSRYPLSTYHPKLPTLDTIFSDNHAWIATLSADHVRVLTATGDIIPARSVNAGVIRRQNPLWPYEKVAPVLNALKTDITFVNLETPLIPACPTTNEGMIFCSDQSNIEGLKSIHVSIANLANNHAGNYGEKGVQQTAELLKKNGITPVGINGPVYKTIRGVTFAFLGYNDITKIQPGVDNADEEQIKKDIHEARKHADVVVVTYHWGVEYRNQPDDRQIELGHFTVTSGADLIIGNHPHWIQPIEFYKDKLITYAHGNFVFDQMWSEETKKGVVGRYTFYDNKLIDVEYLPVYIQNYGQPSFMSGRQKEEVLKDMKEESIKLSNLK